MIAAIELEGNKVKGYKPVKDMLASETIGYRIRYFRLQVGMTQKRLGELCGLKESTISNYEMNKRIPDNEKLLKIAAALDVSPYALSTFDREDPDCSAQILFQLEDLIGLHPDSLDEQLFAGREDLTGFIDEWKRQYDLYAGGEISEEEYFKWQTGYHHAEN